MLVFLMSCSTPNPSRDRANFYLEETEFAISHDHNLISNRFVFTKLIGSDSIIYYEQRERDFYLFDLKNRVLKKFLNYDIDGPNFMDNEVLDFEKVGDRYAILSTDYLSISDKNGQILKRELINQFIGNMESSGISRTHHIITKSGDELYLAQSPRAVIAPFKYDGINPPIFANYDLVSDSIATLPIYSPEETLIEDDANGFYGSDAEHFFFVKDNCIIFNFRFSPSIYRYCFQNQKLIHYDGKTNRFPDTAEPFPANSYRDPEYLVKHKLLGGIKFSNLEYDAKNNVYVRFASEKIYNEQSRRSQNQVFLQVFDSDFKNVLEQRIRTPVKPEVYMSNGSIYMIGVGNYQREENITKFLKVDLRRD